MKQITFILTAMLFVFAVTQTAFSQKNVSMFNKYTVKELYKADSVNMSFNESRMNDVNIKAVRDFMKWYKNIDNVEWYTVQDGFIAKFQKDGVETKVLYDASGGRSNTVKTYDEAHMPFEIRDLIKKQYYDYNILVTYEIEHSKGSLYIAKIMNNTSIKVLRIENNEIKVQEDYTNANGSK